MPQPAHIIDHTLQAAEALVAHCLPSAGYPVRLASDKQEAEADEVDVVEVVADPYTVALQDEDGVPAWATLQVLVNFTSDNTKACEQVLRVLSGALFGLTPSRCSDILRQMPDPLRRLEVYACAAVCTGQDINPDDTYTAQYQVTLTLRPLLFSVTA